MVLWCQLEGREFTITEKGPFSFEIDFDTSSCGTFVSGYVNQVHGVHICHNRWNRTAVYGYRIICI